MLKFSTFFAQYAQQHKLKDDVAQMHLAKMLDRYVAKIDEAKHRYIRHLQKLFGRKKGDKAGLYIWGEVGGGKTLILNELFGFLCTQRKLRKHFHEFMLDAHKALHSLGNEQHGSAMTMYAKQMHDTFDVIILDELQINNIADAMIVDRLFRALIKQGVLIIFSSNREPSELFKDGLQRERFLPFIDLIQNHFDVAYLNSAMDYRLEHFTFNHVYLYPNDLKAQTAVDEMVYNLTGRNKLESLELQIAENRKLIAHQCYGHVAVFTFKELCEVHLGALDYLAICKAFSVVFIKNIPQLTQEHHNQALRFITLIDCLYEHNIKTICTAECKIDLLYMNGKNNFEFQRTISRLKEMQTEQYLGKSLKEIYNRSDIGAA